MKTKGYLYARVAAASMILCIITICLWGIDVYAAQNFFCDLSILCGTVFLFCSFQASHHILEEKDAKGKK